MNQNCEHHQCTFPGCSCTANTNISKQRALASHRYRNGIRLLLIERMEAEAKARNISKSAVSQLIGISGTQYSRIIHGHGQHVTIDALLLYLERLGVGIELAFEPLDSSDTEPQKVG